MAYFFVLNSGRLCLSRNWCISSRLLNLYNRVAESIPLLSF